MKILSKLSIATILASLMLNIQADSTFAANTLSKHQIPYVEQAIAHMRDGIEAQKKIKKTGQKIGHAQTANQVIHLTQRDFDSGTYRIRTPNTTAILDTNIEFEPIPSAEATRSDKPITGWFAAIAVEADNVLIDLNGKTLQASEFFLALTQKTSLPISN